MATCSEQRQLVAQVTRMSEWRIWHAADTVARQTHVSADELPALLEQQRLLAAAAESLAIAEQNMSVVVNRAIEALLR
jgi:hypothetical protein